MRKVGGALSWVLVPAICLIAAIVLFLLDDPFLRAWGFWSLAGIVALDLARNALGRWDVRWLFLPRQLRARLELEKALFAWSVVRRSGTDADPVLRLLRAASRDVRGTALSRQIDGIVHAITVGDAKPQDTKTWPDVDRELRAALDSVAPRPGERYPLGGSWVLPPDCVLPISFIVAVMGVVLVPVPDTSNIVSPHALAVGLAMFGLAYAAMRLAEVMSFTVHEVVSQRTFRVVMVSDREQLNASGYLASELYADIAQLVLIYVDDKLSDVWLPAISGGYHVGVGKADVPDALAAFAGHADLIVLDSEDHALAASIKAETSLPASRYLALSRDGSVPSGYSWIEPMTLRIRPSDRRIRNRDVDFYALGVMPGGSIWRLSPSLVLAIAGLFLFRHGGMVLAVLLWMVAVAKVLPELLGPRRRAKFSRSTLRIPAAPDFSRRLEPRALAFRLAAATALLTLAACALVRPPVGLDWSNIVSDWNDRQYTVLLKLWGVMLVYGALYMGFVSGVLLALKWWIDWDFRFLILRRNSRRHGFGHKAYVMATCGRFGQVISIRDDTLDQTDTHYGAGRESALGSWFPTFTEIDTTLRPITFVQTWQRQVLLELEVTDFAVFDWIDEITDNMRWELRSAAERLPAHRIMVVHSPDNQAEVDGFFASCGALFSERPLCLMEPRDADDGYLWPDHRDFDQAFTDALHKALTALREEPRHNRQREAFGTWPFPRRAF